MYRNETLEYYEQNAAAFATDTESVAFAEIKDQFLDLLPPGKKILDFGCVSGRDTKYFLERGYSVDATESVEFALSKADRVAEESNVRMSHEEVFGKLRREDE